MVGQRLTVGDWDFSAWSEYRQISQFYGTRTTLRTKIPWINHINEGVVLIHQLEGSIHEAKAFCLHPLFQADETYHAALSEACRIYNLNTNPEVLFSVLGYREAANRWLRNAVTPTNLPQKHPLESVNIMLMADKIQNRKDFEANEAVFGVEDAASLHSYFDSWFTALGITPEIYDDQVKSLAIWTSLSQACLNEEEHKP